MCANKRDMCPKTVMDLMDVMCQIITKKKKPDKNSQNHSQNSEKGDAVKGESSFAEKGDKNKEDEPTCLACGGPTYTIIPIALNMVRSKRRTGS